MSTCLCYYFKILLMWDIYMYVLHFKLKPIHHMHNNEWLQTIEILTITTLGPMVKQDIRCNDQLQILKLSNVTECV